MIEMESPKPKVVHKRIWGRAKIKGTVEYFMQDRWEHINERTVNGYHPREMYRKNYLSKGIRLEMTRQEFYDFCLQYKSRIERYYREKRIPSVDRIDPAGHYAISNIQIIDMAENRKRAQAEVRKMFYGMPVVRTSLEHGYSEEFSCIATLRKEKLNLIAVRACCLGKRDNYAGFTWKYKETTTTPETTIS